MRGAKPSVYQANVGLVWYLLQHIFVFLYFEIYFRYVLRSLFGYGWKTLDSHRVEQIQPTPLPIYLNIKNISFKNNMNFGFSYLRVPKELNLEFATTALPLIYRSILPSPTTISSRKFSDVVLQVQNIQKLLLDMHNYHKNVF